MRPHALSVVVPFLFPLSSRAAFDWASIRCDKDNSTLPTPTYGDSGALFTVCAETTIHAPLSSVYNAVLDFKSYAAWNSFTVDVAVPENVTRTPEDVYVGMEMVLTTQGLLPANTTSNEIITVLNPEDEDQEGFVAMAAWRNDDGLNATFLPAEHPTILTDAGDGVTRYVSYETYYEPGAASLLALRSNLQRAFERQGGDVKVYVEKLVWS